MLELNKRGNITINTRNLELMLLAFPDIYDDLLIVEFRSTRNTSVSFRGDISSEAVRSLAVELQQRGWFMPGTEYKTDHALQNAVFKLYEADKLNSVECDYFEGEPLAAREWEGNTVDYSSSLVALDGGAAIKATSAPMKTVDTGSLAKETDAVIATAESGKSEAA